VTQIIEPAQISTASTAYGQRATVRVVSIPAAHPYVRSVTSSSSVELLGDPRHAGAPAAQWWPPIALDSDWIHGHATDGDILHIHFGTESFTPEQLQATLDTAHDVGWPVVFTVHDLVHPQLVEQIGYASQLDVLVPGADALLTLTPGAATEIARRWNRHAAVMGHPALLRTFPPSPQRSPDDGVFRVGMFLKALDELAADGLDAVGEVRMHRRIRDTRLGDRVRDLCRGSGRITLVHHDRLDDDALAATLAALDACVLPYGYGSHSGWLELCWDLGVPVAVPTTGFYAEQHAHPSIAAFAPDAGGSSLAATLRQFAGSPQATRAGTEERAIQMMVRRRQRVVDDRAVADAHVALYRRLLAKN
jgi:hypothetical protein